MITSSVQIESKKMLPVEILLQHSSVECSEKLAKREMANKMIILRKNFLRVFLMPFET
jgi:hypothetical protein